MSDTTSRDSSTESEEECANRNSSKRVRRNVFDGELTELSNDIVDPTIDKQIISGYNSFIKVNTAEHHTNNYDEVKHKYIPKLIVRRGQEFIFSIFYKKSVLMERIDSITLKTKFKDIENPEKVNGAVNVIPLSTSKKKSTTEWVANLIKKSDVDVLVGITAPVNCFVGKWQLKFGAKNDKNTLVYSDLTASMHILFNPWCEEDQVYLKNIEECNECILGGTGMVFHGTFQEVSSFPWEYSQFGTNILQMYAYIFHQSKRINPEASGDAVQVCRVCASLGSPSKEMPIMVLSEDGDFSSGQNPEKWTCSEEILNAFWKKKTSVKFGLNWNFAGLVTTICRAIGIPSRVVSVFNIGLVGQNKALQAFDGQVRDILDKRMAEIRNDNASNFHVWSECWLIRTDLSATGEYDGWHVVDATPYNLEGQQQYTVGPAPVSAVKNGHVMVSYDSRVIFAEVNSHAVGLDKTVHLSWRSVNLLKEKQTSCLYTKANGKMEKIEITSNYRHPIDSQEENKSITKALADGTFNEINLLKIMSDHNQMFGTDLEIEQKDVIVGGNLKVKFHYGGAFIEKSNLEKTFDYLITIEFKSTLNNKYFGIKKYQDSLILKVKKEVVEFLIGYKEYSEVIRNKGNGHFRVSLIFQLPSTHLPHMKLEVYDEKLVPLTHSKLQMKVMEEKKPNSEQSLIRIFFVNNLPFSIRGTYHIKGPSVDVEEKTALIKKNNEVHYVFKANKVKPGENASYLIRFESEYLESLSGTVSWIDEKWQLNEGKGES